MNIQVISLSDYKPAAYNPRIDLRPGDAEYEKIKGSIEEFGFLEPLVVNQRTKRIISGHQRVKILQEQGVCEVEAVIVDFDETKEKAANLALNKVSGHWDNEKLAALLDELSRVPDFNIGITGFDPPEISHLLDRYRKEPDDENFDFDREVESIVEPVTKRGDLIILGPHRILCGDSANPNDLERLMNGEKADMVDTDYPYNVNYGGGNKPNPNTRPKKSRRWPQIYSDNMPQAEYETWMKKVLVNIKQCIKPGAPFYIWQGLRQIPPLCQSLIDLDLRKAGVSRFFHL